jgi:hypothetical protein
MSGRDATIRAATEASSGVSRHRKLDRGKPVDCSEITPNPAEWWSRPVIGAPRVGEQRAEENMRLYRDPFLATSSIADGVAAGQGLRWLRISHVGEVRW